MTTVLLFVLALAQEGELIKRHQKEYNEAIALYSAANQQLTRDPSQALTLINDVFAIKNISTKDRTITIERLNLPVRTVDFYPNLLRGRIRLSLAQKDAENAVTLLPMAERDFKTSYEMGIQSAEAYLKQTRTLIDRLGKTPTVKAPVPPAAKPGPVEEAFREPWFKLIETHKYKSALDLIEAKGGSLGAEKRKDYVRDTEDQCRKYVEAQLESFIKAVDVNFRGTNLRPSPVEFARQFELPAAADMVGKYPVLDWARKERAALEALRAAPLKVRAEDFPPVLEQLLGAMLEAEALTEASAENRWLRSSGEVALRYVEEVIGSFVVQSKECTPEERRKLREQAEAARTKWSEALAKLPRVVVFRNRIQESPKRLLALLDGFPVDVEELDKISVEACFVSDVPDAALDHVIADLTKIRDQHGARLPREATRKLLTELVAATAVRDLLLGKSVEEVTKGLQELGRSLMLSGGPLAPAQFGPKIEKIFTALRG